MRQCYMGKRKTPRDSGEALRAILCSHTTLVKWNMNYPLYPRWPGVGLDTAIKWWPSLERSPSKKASWQTKQEPNQETRKQETKQPMNEFPRFRLLFLKLLLLEWFHTCCFSKKASFLKQFLLQKGKIFEICTS